MAGTEATDSTLALRTVGTGDRVVVFLHGFAQTGACAGPLAEGLGPTRRVLLPDAPGHGGSSRHAAADLWSTADLLVATLDDAGAVAPVDVVGYSLGARTALHLVLAHPGRVRSLALVGGTAGIEDPVERAARRRDDRARADHLEQVGVEAFLEEWLALPLFAALPRWARFEDERRTNSAAGLAASLRRCGTGTMDPLWGRIGRIGVPTLCLAGAADRKFSALARRVAATIGPAATCELVAGAGHAAHLERPGAVTDAVRRHLDGVDAAHPPT